MIINYQDLKRQYDWFSIGDDQNQPIEQIYTCTTPSQRGTGTTLMSLTNLTLKAFILEHIQ
jgi:hypothetical protein